MKTKTVQAPKSASSQKSEVNGQSERLFVLRSKLHPDPDQPRKDFAAEALAELADSLASNGIEHNLIVRPHPAKRGEFLIVDGERRWRASGLKHIEWLPIEVRALDSAGAHKHQLIAGTQRANLTEIEAADSLWQQFGQAPKGTKFDEFAAGLGLKRSTAYNRRALALAPKHIRQALSEGKLELATATLVLTVQPESEQTRLLEWIKDQCEYDGMPSYRDVQDETARNYCKSLKGAPFKLDKVYEQGSVDAGAGKLVGLIPLAKMGTCAACPHRSGNVPNWPETKKPDVCLLPACYRAKALAAAQRRGEQTLAPELFAQSKKEYVAAGEYQQCGDQGYTDVVKAMGRHAPPPITTVDERGEVKQVYPKSAIKPALLAAGVKFEKSAPNASDKKRAALINLREATAHEIAKKLPAALSNKLTGAGVLTFLLEAKANLKFGVAALARELGWPEFAKMSEGRQRAAVVGFLALENPMNYDHYGQNFQRACKLAGINLKAEEKRQAMARTEKKPSPAKQPKAAKAVKKGKKK